MKKLMTALLLLTLCEAHALEFRVQKMKKAAGFTERYDLQTNLTQEVALDCQSFIQGLIFGQAGDNAVMLQEWVCQELSTAMKKSQRQGKEHCLVVDEANNVLESQQTCL